MSSGLPVDLIDETSRVLDTVVGLNLPERRWAAVGAAIGRVDDAVEADDTKALRTALIRLRETAAGLVPSEPPIRRRVRRPGAVADEDLDYASKIPIRWLAVIIGGAVVVLGVLIVVVMVALSGGDDRGRGAPPATPTSEVAPSPTVAPESPDSPRRGGGVGAPAVIVVVAVGGVAFFAYRIWRRRTGASLFGRGAARRAVDAQAEDRVPAPIEIVDTANRAAASLPGRGG